MRSESDLEFQVSRHFILETSASFDFSLLFREIILFLKELISIQVSLKLSLNDRIGKFYEFCAMYFYSLYLYSSLLEKLQSLQGETSVTFIVYSALIELQELHFRVISG